MRWWKWLLPVLLLFFSLGMARFSVVSAVSTWLENNWSGGDFVSSSGVNTSTVNQIALNTNVNWFDSSWKYRQSVSVTNGSGADLTDYQIPIFINTSTLISNSKMKNDCSDLRVTDASGTALSYWIATAPTASTCNQTTTKVWVKANSLSTSGATLYVYYGNSSASSNSNGANVFATFADFSTLSSLPSGWTKTDIGTSGTYSVNGSLSISNTNGQDIWNSIYGGTHVYYDTKISGSFTAEALVTSQYNSDVWAKSGISVQNNMSSGGGNGQAFIVVTPNNGVPFQYQSTTGEQCSGGSCPTVIAPNVNLGSVEGTSLSFPILLKLTKDGSNRVSGYRSTTGSSWTQQGSTVTPWGIASSQYVSLFLTPHNTSAVGNAVYAFFYTRKFSATEPGVGSPTSEQQRYVSSGNLTSSIYNTGVPANYGVLSFVATTPTNTTVTVKARTSNSSEMTGASDFSSCNSISSGSDISSNNCVTDGHRYIQYQVLLAATDYTATPVFQSISIQFDSPTYTISFLAGSHGSISGSATQTISYGGDATSVTAVADSGYHFTNWSDGNTQNPRTIAMVTADKTVTANFAADDAEAPVISGENVSVSTNSATVAWSTNEAASSMVQYGLNTSYGFATSELDTSPRVTAHNMSVSGLKSCARYYYRVISSDTVGNQSTSAQKSFSTSGCAASSITSGTETVLPVSGGTVTLINSLSTAELQVPNNYAAQQATFQINKLDTASAPSVSEGKTIAASNFYDLIAVTDGGQQLSSFSTPISFTITYGSDTENDYVESTLDVYKYDGTNWIKKNCTLDTSARTLTCSLSSFSVYAVLGDPKSGSGSSSSSGTSVSNSSSSSLSECNNLPPASISDLFQIDTEANKAKLFFTPLSDTNTYYISFSERQIAEDFGEQVTLTREGVQSHTIFFLKPNTTYYIKIRGQNGCMPGKWSNTMSFTTNGATYYRYYQTSTPVKSEKLKRGDETLRVEVTPTPVLQETNNKEMSTSVSKRCFLWWCW